MYAAAGRSNALLKGALVTSRDRYDGTRRRRSLDHRANRHVTIIAHPTGRLIGEREPYEVDIEAVVAAAADHGCHLELNADPDRLDLTDIHAHAAKSAGVRLAISTDAHTTGGFANMRFGVDQARRAWVEPADVINTRPLSKFRKQLNR